MVNGPKVFMREIGIRRLRTGNSYKTFLISKLILEKGLLTRKGKGVPSGALSHIGRLTCPGEGNRSDL